MADLLPKMKASQVAAVLALLAALASLALPGIPHSFAAPDELLVNGDFEEGIGDEWLVYGGNLTRVSHAGGFAAEFTTSTTGWFYQLVQVQSGAIYSFSGYAQNNDPDIASVYLQIRWFSSADGYGEVGAPIFSTEILTTDGGYHFLTTLPATAPDAAHSARAEVMLKLTSPGTATAYFDSMSFTGPPPTPTPTPSPSPSPTPSPSPSPTPTAALSPTPEGTIANEGDVVINEVHYDPPQADGDYEWVELFNRTGEAIHLEGWRIRDNRESDSIPPLILPASGFAVIAATEEGFRANFPDFDGSIVFVEDGRIGSGLNNEGDCIILEDGEGRIIDALSYGDDSSQSPHCPDVASGHSLERVPAGGEFMDNPDPTPGYSSPPAPTPTETPVETPTPIITPTATPTAPPPGSPTPESTGGSAFSGMALRGVGIALAIAVFGILFWVARRRGSKK